MAAKGLVRVGISITTLDPKLSRALEPRAPAPAHRLRTIRALADAGIPVRVMVAPVIPGLTDPEMEAIMTAAHGAGASAASYIALRLPREVSQLFQSWLERHAPTRAAKVMARIREMHGGRDYDPNFGTRFVGTGVWANLQAQRFVKSLDRLGLQLRQPPLRCDLFAVPTDQLSLF
jgi:DNA repair photolyase